MRSTISISLAIVSILAMVPLHNCNDTHHSHDHACPENDPECTVVSCLEQLMELHKQFKQSPESVKLRHEYFQNLRKHTEYFKNRDWKDKKKPFVSHIMGSMFLSPHFAEKAKELQRRCSHLKIESLNAISTRLERDEGMDEPYVQGLRSNGRVELKLPIICIGANAIISVLFFVDAVLNKNEERLWEYPEEAQLAISCLTADDGENDRIKKLSLELGVFGDGKQHNGTAKLNEF